ncbi:AAA family ATPase [Flagellimonas oceanensis]|uniref:AAA family ATPase n=1 Tax=Flagellimonas oceanensis TaxID=2499163 RepID=UPI000F8CAC40|nr:AAA family ATPase [Allomuricauda oceanensis]
MLDRIVIKGYKSIRHLDIELKSVNILIGSNGVGKSNFVSFFKLVNNIYEQRLKQFSMKSGSDNLLYFGRKETDFIEGFLNFGNNAYSFKLEPNDDGGLFINEEHSIYHPAPYNKSFWNNNVQESGIKTSSSIRDRYLREHLESYKIYHFHDTSSAAPLRTPANIDDNRMLREDGDNLAAYLYYIMEKFPKNFRRIEKTIQSIAPFFEKFNLEPDRLDESRIKLVWNEKDHIDTYFDASHLSDGSLRFIALTTLLMQPKLPKVIIIDEPELGLHPVAINKLAALIKSASQKDCQIIISTQSVNLLNNFEIDQVITVDKVDNQSSFSRLEHNRLKDWLDDYSLGELWSKSVINGQPI